MANLRTTSGCQAFLNDLLEEPPESFGRKDSALLNLLCAKELPGSETLDIPNCLEALDRIAAYVKQVTDKYLHFFPSDPTYGHSEPMWRMAWLVKLLKQGFKAAYHPEAKADLEAGIERPFSDSSEVFIHGLLSPNPEKRWGTCTSIPALIVAVARRLHYPVGLAVTRKHVYARWDNGAGTAFNVEASNGGDMTSEPDEYYRKFPRELSPEEDRSGFFVRSLTPSEEFGLFLRQRTWCLYDTARYDEVLLWAARALQFAADDPNFPKLAAMMTDHGLKHRYSKKYPHRKIPAPDQQFDLEVGDLLRLEERSLHMTIQAHRYESEGKLGEAREHYEDACRLNFQGNNEHRDIQRFLRKHGLRRVVQRSLSPNNQRLRRFQLKCKPFEERGTLGRLADQFERNGELVKAHDALRDLYLFDPADTEIFQRARSLERQPYFQVQIKALYEERKRVLRLRAANQRIGTPQGA